MTIQTIEQHGVFKRWTSFLWAVFQNLDSSYIDHSADQIGLAMERIRTLEAEVADLKARLSA